LLASDSAMRDLSAACRALSPAPAAAPLCMFALELCAPLARLTTAAFNTSLSAELPAAAATEATAAVAALARADSVQELALLHLALVARCHHQQQQGIQRSKMCKQLLRHMQQQVLPNAVRWQQMTDRDPHTAFLSGASGSCAVPLSCSLASSCQHFNYLIDCSSHMYATATAIAKNSYRYRLRLHNVNLPHPSRFVLFNVANVA